jgi:hypothetical protein
LTQISTATTTTVVPSPSSGQQSRVKTLIVSNAGSAAETTSVNVYDGTNTDTIATFVQSPNAPDAILDEAALLLLGSTSDTISVTGGSTQTLDVSCEWVDYDTGSTAVTPGRQVTAPGSFASPTVVVPSPGLSTTFRNVKMLSINNAGTLAETVAVTIYDGTHTVTIGYTTLAAGYSYQWTPQTGWQTLNNVGNVAWLSTGMMGPIRIVTGTATITSTFVVPPGAYGYQVSFVATVAYTAGATVAVAINGVTVMNTNQNNPQGINDPRTIMLVNTALGTTATVVTVTITGASAGAGVVEIMTGIPVS